MIKRWPSAWPVIKRWLAVPVVTALMLVFGPVGAVRADELIRPVISCADVQDVALDGVTVTETSVRHRACHVRGTIAPATTFVIRLPLDGWTGRYLQTGCGGMCGTATITYVQSATCRPLVDGTIATASTDLGHRADHDGSWAYRNPQAITDFAYRATHLTAVTAKAIIARFYGRAPVRSYFNGCSDGGREALMEAQRYPDDFDGIAAGAPVANLVVQDTFHHAWGVLTNRDAGGRPILLAGRLPLIHRAVLSACDTLDGRADGVLDDPRRCDFDPYTIVCRPLPGASAPGPADRAEDPSTCLTSAEAQVVRRIHDGATDGRGRRLEPAVAREWGSELGWTIFVPATPTDTTWSENYATGFLRYLAYEKQSPTAMLTDLAFTEESFHSTVRSSAYLAAVDPDLSAFHRRGGKLLLWHGWSDAHVAPSATIAYWAAMRKSLGTVDGFTKFYMIPGLGHCTGGSSFDVMTPLLNWVEGEQEPGSLMAGGRPVGPFRESGDGSSWLGEYLFAHGYQAA